MSIASRAKHLFERIRVQTKSFSPRRKEYGWKVAWSSFWDGIIPPGKSKRYIKTIEAYVDKAMSPVVEKYKNFDEPFLPYKTEKIPVWCCWWQGEEQMPEIVRLCYSRLKSLIPNDAELHLLTEKNYRQYVTIPEHVLQKFKKGKMCTAHFIDVLRLALLVEYGGFWIDATVFISGDFPGEYLHHDYYAQRMYNCGIEQTKREACKGRWSTFLVSGRRNLLLFRYLLDAHCEWWRTHDSVIDYVTFDYMWLSGYKGVPAIKKMVDGVPNNNIHTFDMYKKLHLAYTDELYHELTKENNLHKLTYKIDLYQKTKDGQETLYAYLLRTYNAE